MGSLISKEHLELLVHANIRFVTLMLDGPSKVFTLDERRIWDDRVTATIHDLATYGIFVRAPRLDLGEQPDKISRGASGRPGLSLTIPSLPHRTRSTWVLFFLRMLEERVGGIATS